jgi:hypothetical protein
LVGIEIFKRIQPHLVSFPNCLSGRHC